jgi:two-component system sensor histidine kinase PilS (NtrC family)
MFDPFFTTKANGSGLGLAVVFRAIEAHRGHIFVDSSRSGTRFTVVLPRGANAPVAGAPPARVSAEVMSQEPVMLGAPRA